MIGNSKDVAAVSRHLARLPRMLSRTKLRHQTLNPKKAKMFAGLSQLSTDPSSPELVKAWHVNLGLQSMSHQKSSLVLLAASSALT